MPRYLRAKAAEHAAHIDWAREQLALLREGDLPHVVLLDKLEARLVEDIQRLREIEISINLPGMWWTADKTCWTLNHSLGHLAENYIAGLRQQGPAELRWRSMLLRTAAAIGLTWIEDILVRLDRDLSIVPSHHDDHSIPIFFAPPSQHLSVLSLPGIYHEFGHCVASRFPQVVTVLHDVVAAYFAEEKKRLGPLHPAQKKTRLQQIDAAADYWTDHRLVEVFCDIFASYTCGCVNVLSMVDLARASGSNPHAVDHDYPAYGAEAIHTRWTTTIQRMERGLPSATSRSPKSRG